MSEPCLNIVTLKTSDRTMANSFIRLLNIKMRELHNFSQDLIDEGALDKEVKSILNTDTNEESMEFSFELKNTPLIIEIVELSKAFPDLEITNEYNCDSWVYGTLKVLNGEVLVNKAIDTVDNDGWEDAEHNAVYKKEGRSWVEIPEMDSVIYDLYIVLLEKYDLGTKFQFVLDNRKRKEIAGYSVIYEMSLS